MYKCDICESTDVEQKCWVALNTMEIAFGDQDDFWCNKCQEHTPVIWEEDIIDTEDIEHYA